MSNRPTREISPNNLSFALPKHSVTALVKSWLTEDIPNFDFGGMVVGSNQQTAHLFIKSPGVLAGVPFFNAIFEELGCEVKWLLEEGAEIDPKGKLKVAEVTGPCCQILAGERTALNCLCRSSGIATNAQSFLKQTQSAGWKGHLAGTRKTTPGFRLVEKYALLIAGVDTHRYNLSSMVMLKDNHVNATGSITKAVEMVKKAGFSVKIEVECSSLSDGMEAAKAGADIIMFDNFVGKAIHEPAKTVKQAFPHILIEASGGVDNTNITDYCGPNIDIISTSKLVQGYPAVDFSLKILNGS